MYAHTHTYIYIHTYIHTHIYIYTYTHTHMGVAWFCDHGSSGRDSCVCIYIHTYIYIYVCMCRAPMYAHKILQTSFQCVQKQHPRCSLQSLFDTFTSNDTDRNHYVVANIFSMSGKNTPAMRSNTFTNNKHKNKPNGRK